MEQDSILKLFDTDTTKMTWDDILKPHGVADNAFGVVTPDPRIQSPNTFEQGTLVEAALFVVIVVIFLFLPHK